MTTKQQNIGRRLEDLYKQQEKWEGSAFKTSNQMLYGILQQCYALEKSMGAEQLSELDRYCTEQKITCKSSAKPIAKIIKCVFRIDRRRVSTYVTALRAAKEDNIASDDLSTWLEKNGGVQEISMRRCSNNKPDAAQRAVEARQVVMHRPVLATVASVELTATYKFKSPEDVVLLLASWNPNGQFEIHQLIQSDSAIEAAFRSCYKTATSQKQIQNTEQMAVDAQKQTLDAIDAVSATLSQKVA